MPDVDHPRPLSDSVNILGDPNLGPWAYLDDDGVTLHDGTKTAWIGWPTFDDIARLRKRRARRLRWARYRART